MLVKVGSRPSGSQERLRADTVGAPLFRARPLTSKRLSALQAVDRPGHVRPGRISVSCRRAGLCPRAKQVRPLKIKKCYAPRALTALRLLMVFSFIIVLSLHIRALFVIKLLDSDGLDDSREAEEESKLCSVLLHPMPYQWLCQASPRMRCCMNNAMVNHQAF